MSALSEQMNCIFKNSKDVLGTVKGCVVMFLRGSDVFTSRAFPLPEEFYDLSRSKVTPAARVLILFFFLNLEFCFLELDDRTEILMRIKPSVRSICTTKPEKCICIYTCVFFLDDSPNGYMYLYQMRK